MRLYMLGFVAGAALLRAFEELPPEWIRWSLLTAPAWAGVLTWVATAHGFKLNRSIAKLGLITALGLGIGWAGFNAAFETHRRLSSDQHRVEVELRGTVVSVVQARALSGAKRSPTQQVLSFSFEPDHWPYAADDQSELSRSLARLLRHWRGGCRLRVSWYRAPIHISAGSRWFLRLRLRPPQGTRNIHGFDREGWMLANRLCGSASVQSAKPLLASQTDTGTGTDTETGTGWARLHGGLSAHRERIAKWLDEQIVDHRAMAIATALTVGERSGFDEQLWTLLQRTGTSHLVAISGLHVGLVAWLGWLLGSVMGVALKRAKGVFGRQDPSAAWPGLLGSQVLTSLLFATAYSALAGFSYPTQRALLMIAVVLLIKLTRRSVAPADSLLLALATVVLVDPLAVMHIGFWLSFGAVAILLLLAGIKGAAAESQVSRYEAWGWRYVGRPVLLQFALVFAMAPMTLFFFGVQSVVAPLVNLVAIPYISFAVLPTLAAAAALHAIAPAIASGLAQFASFLLEGLIELLTIGAEAPMLVATGAVELGAVAAMGFAFYGLAKQSARVICWRSLSIGSLAVVGLLIPHTSQPRGGELWLDVLDVGQGLSVVVRTRSHTLVYDAGNAWDGGFDAGRHVIVPHLRGEGVHELDQVVLSHQHRDHIGGFGALATIFDEFVLLTNVALARAQESCLRGRTWVWDEVEFEVLWPTTPADTGNNGSCVLKISNAAGSVLLTGDIEARAELALLALTSSDNETVTDSQLRSEVLLVAHQGSKTSTHPAFLNAVKPSIGVISAGRFNRFGHPAPVVVERLRRAGVRIWSTALDGAIHIRLDPSGAIAVQSFMSRARRFWHSD